ncbi:MAG: hypothetical protein NXI20_17910 [bacterium]|nr:hypothetical protein [bacterium]
MELDKIEKRVLNKLRKGAVLITDSDHYGAVVSGHGADFEFSGAAFYRMVDKGIIYQSYDAKRNKHEYVLHPNWKETETERV